jgi:aspartate/glutamate racemase
MIGILGGMRLLARLSFVKVIAAMPSSDDADHLLLLIQSDPRLPS